MPKASPDCAALRPTISAAIGTQAAAERERAGDPWNVRGPAKWRSGSAPGCLILGDALSGRALAFRTRRAKKGRAGTMTLPTATLFAALGRHRQGHRPWNRRSVTRPKKLDLHCRDDGIPRSRRVGKHPRFHKPIRLLPVTLLRPDRRTCPRASPNSPPASGKHLLSSKTRMDRSVNPIKKSLVGRGVALAARHVARRRAGGSFGRRHPSQNCHSLRYRDGTDAQPGDCRDDGEGEQAQRRSRRRTCPLAPLVFYRRIPVFRRTTSAPSTDCRRDPSCPASARARSSSKWRIRSC